MIGAGLRLTRAATPAAARAQRQEHEPARRRPRGPPRSPARPRRADAASRVRLRTRRGTGALGSDATGLGRHGVGARCSAGRGCGDWAWTGASLRARVAHARRRRAIAFTPAASRPPHGRAGVGRRFARDAAGPAARPRGDRVAVGSVSSDSAAASATGRRRRCDGAAGCGAEGAAGSAGADGGSAAAGCGAAVGGADAWRRSRRTGARTSGGGGWRTARRQQAERVDVALRIGGHPDAEVDVRRGRDGVGARADDADDCLPRRRRRRVETSSSRAGAASRRSRRGSGS